MAENIVAGLFGLTPQMYGEQQRRSALREGIDLAKLSPGEAGAAMTYAGARGLSGAIAGAMGIEDPQLKLISARQQVLGQLDQSDPTSLLNGAKTLAQMGDQQGAFALADFARKAQVQIAEQQQRLAAGQASLAQAAKTELSVRQEEELRSKLSALGPNATQDQVIGVLTQYGPPEKVLAALTAAQSKTEATLARTATAEDLSPKPSGRSPSRPPCDGWPLQSVPRLPGAPPAGLSINIPYEKGRRRAHLQTPSAGNARRYHILSDRIYTVPIIQYCPQ